MLQKIINSLIYLTVFSLPLYLVSFKVGWVPTNVLELLICILFVFWAIGLFGSKDRLFFNSKIWLPVLLIFIGVTIAVWFSSDLEVSAGIWKGWFVVPLLFFIVVINHIKTKEQVENIIVSLTLSGALVGLVALYYWLNNDLTYDGRLSAFYLSPNYLAMYLSPILILSLYLYSIFKQRVYKITLLIIYFLFALVIYLTYSYGAWLGLLAALAFILFQRKNKKILLIFFLFVVLISIIQIPSDKFQGFLDLSYPSLESRLVIWQSSWEILKDNFLIGIGPGMFQKYYLAYQDIFKPYPEWAVPQPHNVFLAFWLQTGLLGLIGFIWLLLIYFVHLLKKTDPKYVLGSVLIGLMIYILVHGLVDTTYWKNDLAIIFFLIIALGYKAGYLTD